MNIFIQDCKTEKFLRLDSMWTSKVREAFDFLSISKAVNLGQRELKESFRVVEFELNSIPVAAVLVAYGEVLPLAEADAPADNVTG